MSGIFYDQNEAVTIIPSIIFSRFPILKFFGPGFSIFLYQEMYFNVLFNVFYQAKQHTQWRKNSKFKDMF